VGSLAWPMQVELKHANAMQLISKLARTNMKNLYNSYHSDLKDVSEPG
jgi:hypothetical protein